MWMIRLRDNAGGVAFVGGGPLSGSLLYRNQRPNIFFWGGGFFFRPTIIEKKIMSVVRNRTRLSCRRWMALAIDAAVRNGGKMGIEQLDAAAGVHTSPHALEHISSLDTVRVHDGAIVVTPLLGIDSRASIVELLRHRFPRGTHYLEFRSAYTHALNDITELVFLGTIVKIDDHLFVPPRPALPLPGEVVARWRELRVDSALQVIAGCGETPFSCDLHPSTRRP